MKYRQAGYRDNERRQAREQPRQQDDDARQAARQVRHAMERSASVIIRCADCGHQTDDAIELTPATVCGKCGASLHNCRNCRYFDTSARFECAKPIPERIPSKSVANQCESYEARGVLDATGKRARVVINDPRKAFDDLFRKKP